MESTSPLSSRPIRTTVLMTTGILVLFAGTSLTIRWYVLPERMDDLLMNAAEEDVPQQMDLVLQHTPAPYRKLAVWMGSERSIIALESSKRLHRQIDLWEKSSGVQIAPEATELVEALNEQYPGYPNKVRQDVHDLATRMASWNLGNGPSGEGAFLVSLEQLLSRKASMPTEATSAASDAMLSEYLQKPSENTLDRREIRPVDQVNRVPLNTGLPWSPIELPSLPLPAMEVRSITPAPQTESGLEPEALPANRKVRLNQPLKLPPLVSSPRPLAPGLKLPEALPDYGPLTTLEVIWKLHAQSPQVVEQAREELASRRFSSEDLKLASRVSHPELAERLKLVRELPLMAREDRKTWLYYMTKDPDESVRYAAAAALITSSDPRLLRQLNAELATDPSPRVRQLIQR